jgi:translation initiation factor 2B subunit (eIF-2B alpha/beta/delta family)
MSIFPAFTMDFDTLSNKLIETIRNDFVNGSLTIAKNALRGLIEIVERAYPNDTNKLGRFVIELKKTKPAMSALQNVLERALSAVSSGDRFALILQLNKLLELLEKSTSDAINIAKEYITQNFTPPYRIVTASFSSTFLKFAKELSKIESTEIFCLESKWAGQDYSALLAEKLTQIGVVAKNLPMVAIGTIANCSFAMIGADCVSHSGVVNGVPSQNLALQCNNHDVPLFVLAESIKYSRKCNPESGFDFIDSSLISKIFSDDIFVNK